MPNWKKVITSGSDAILNEITSSGGILTSQDIMPDVDNTLSLGSSTQRFQLNGGTPVTVGGSGTTNTMTRFSAATEVENSTITNTNSLTTITHDNDGNAIFVISGSNGELIKVTDTISDTLFQVNDGSGITMFEVSSSGESIVNGDLDADDVTIDGWGSVSASLASVNSDSSNLTLQDVTDNGSTTTNALTINNGTVGATTLHVDGNHDFPLKVTSDNLTGDPYMELGGGGIRVIDSPTSAFHIYMDQNGGGSVTEVARFSETQFTTQNNANIYADGELFASGGLSIYTINNAGTDTDKFLVLDAGGTVDFRTGAELRGDIGAGTGNGSVTSVGGTGTVSGLTLSGTVTTSGNLTLGGTISLVAGDIPDLNASKITAGTFAVARIPDITSAKITDVDAFSQSGTYASLRAQATTKGDVGLGLVENTALSTWGGSSNITTIGTVTSGDVSAILPSGTISGSITSPSQGTISVNGNNIDLGLQAGDSPTFNDVTISGNLTVEGSRTELQVTQLNVEDKNILVASGAADSAAADGAGITIGGANESLTWDHSNSRFTFSDDLRVDNSLNIGSVSNAGADTDKFLVLDSNGNVDFRTGTEVRSDIGAGTSNYGDSDVTDHINSLNVVSGSSQITISNTSGYTTFSSSLATDISSNVSTLNSKPSKYAASGSRMAVWKDNDTVRGFDSLHYFDNGGSDIGIRLNPSSVTGRTIRTGQSGGSSGVQVLITRNPNKTYGATIDYVVFNSLTNRTAYRIGREVSAWDNNGANIVGTGYTSFGFGTLPADLEVSIIESSGEMYLNMTWSGGGTYYISANIDTFGSGI